MSYVLAVARPNTFAAIASVGGLRYTIDGVLRPSFLPRVPSRPVPLMHIHGTADTVVPYGGGHFLHTRWSVPEVSRARWRNGLTTTDAIRCRWSLNCPTWHPMTIRQ